MSENAVIPFQFENHNVRVMDRDGEPWFVLADVCRVLEIGNPSDAGRRLDEDERMTLDLVEGHSGRRGGARKLNIINESGLYALILTSDKPEAKRLRKWVTADVIPTIRKTGEYRLPGKSPARLSRDAAREARLSWKLATTIAASVGLKGNQLLIAANRYTRRVLGIDMLETMGVPLLPAPEPEVLLTATDIGQKLSLSAGGERNVHPSLDPQTILAMGLTGESSAGGRSPLGAGEPNATDFVALAQGHEVLTFDVPVVVQALHDFQVAPAGDEGQTPVRHLNPKSTEFVLLGCGHLHIVLALDEPFPVRVEVPSRRSLDPAMHLVDHGEGDDLLAAPRPGDRPGRAT